MCVCVGGGGGGEGGCPDQVLAEKLPHKPCSTSLNTSLRTGLRQRNKLLLCSTMRKIVGGNEGKEDLAIPTSHRVPFKMSSEDTKWV